MLRQKLNLTDLLSRSINGKRMYEIYIVWKHHHFGFLRHSTQVLNQTGIVTPCQRPPDTWDWARVGSLQQLTRETISYNEFSQKAVHWTSEKDVVVNYGMPLKNLWKKDEHNIYDAQPVHDNRSGCCDGSQLYFLTELVQGENGIRCQQDGMEWFTIQRDLDYYVHKI